MLYIFQVSGNFQSTKKGKKNKNEGDLILLLTGDGSVV